MGDLKGSSESETTVPQFVTDAGKFGVDRSKQLAEMGYMPYFGPDVAALSPMEYAGMQNTNNAAAAFGMAAPGMGGGMQGGGQGGGMQGQGAPFTGNMQTQTGNYMPAQVGDSPKAQAINDAYLRHLGRAPDQAGFEFWKQNYNPDTFQQDFTQGTQVDPMTGLPMPGNFGGMGGYSSGPMYQGAVNELQRRRPGQFEAYESMFVDPQTEQMAGAQQDQGRDQNQGLLDQVTGTGRFGDAQRLAIEQYGDASMAHMFMK